MKNEDARNWGNLRGIVVVVVVVNVVVDVVMY